MIFALVIRMIQLVYCYGSVNILFLIQLA